MRELHEFEFVLSNRGLEKIGVISVVDPTSVKYIAHLNSADELFFTAHKPKNIEQYKIYERVVDFAIVYIPQINKYFQIAVSKHEDGKYVTKDVTGTELCEAELGQTMLYNIEINSENDIARDDYVVTTFYNKDNPQGSLLNRILEKAPHYKIGHVDDSLCKIQRTFSIDGTAIYDFLTTDCAEQFNCLFQFDSTTRTISVYDLYTVCNKCGKRGDYKDVCPECGSTDLRYFGDDTTIYVDSENLSDDITYETDVDSVKNILRLVAGDDVMTAAVQNMNPNGSNYLYYFSDDVKALMSQDLRDKLAEYDKKYQSKVEEYATITKGIYDGTAEINKLQHTMMPTYPNEELSAKNEVKLIEDNINILAVENLTDKTTIAVVNNAMKNLCKVYAKSGYFKIEIPDDASGNTTATYKYTGKDSDGNATGTWSGTIKITSYSNEKDTATTKQMTIKVTTMFEEFLKQKINKVLARDISEKDEKNKYSISVVSLLSPESFNLGTDDDGDEADQLEKLKKAVKLYSLTLLTNYRDAVQSVLDTLQSFGQAQLKAQLYEPLYTPYYQRMLIIQDEMDVRQKSIDEENKKLDDLYKRRDAIQSELNLRDFLGEKLFDEFCSFRREDTYQNDNFISDGLSDDEIIKNAQDYWEAAKEQIVKSGTAQHTISGTLYDLLKIKEFKPLREHFKLGNWIRLGIDSRVYRLRLSSWGVDFNDVTHLTVEFTDLTQASTLSADIGSILSSAQSMATSYSYVSRQSNKGNEANKVITGMRTDGLNAALYKIANNDQEETTYDNHGLTVRAYDDNALDYNPEQLKMTHNILAYTRDAWKTVSLAIGKQDYTIDGVHTTGYGMNADYVLSGTIIGGSIYSENYSTGDNLGTYIDLNNGSFNFAGGKIQYDNSTSRLTMRDVELDIGGTYQNAGEAIDNTNKTVKSVQSNMTTLSNNVDTLSTTVNNAYKNIQDYYIVTDSSTTVPDVNNGDWQIELPTQEDGKFIWKKTVLTRINNDTETQAPICITSTGSGGTGEKGADAVQLYISSSQGVLFKNSEVSTVLSAVVITGGQRIENITDLRAKFGNSATLIWKWKRISDDDFKTILSTDERIGNDGFTLTLSPDDVDVKTIFSCDLDY